MKTQFFLLKFLLVSFSGFAQLSQNKDLTEYYIQQSRPCGGFEELFKQKGSWSKQADVITFPDKTFPSSQYPLVLSRLDKFLPIIKEAIPDLSGMEAIWLRNIDGNSIMPNGPVPYQFQSSYPEYFCSNEKKIELTEEPQAWVSIFINHYNNWFAEKINDWDIHGDGKMITIYQMPDTLGKLKGVRIFEPKKIPGTYDHAIVIGHNGKMPWFTLSQKQYLTGYKNHLESNRSKQLDATGDIYIRKSKDNIASMQASKALTTEEKKVIVGKLEQQLKDYQDKLVKDNGTTIQRLYEEQIKPVNDYLDTASPSTLNQPAILDKKTNYRFKGYFAKPGEAGIKLIAFPAKYFNKQLPRYVPQFIIIYWHWGTHPANLLFAKAFEENLPVEKLQALIDQ